MRGHQKPQQQQRRAKKEGRRGGGEIYRVHRAEAYLLRETTYVNVGITLCSERQARYCAVYGRGVLIGKREGRDITGNTDSILGRNSQNVRNAKTRPEGTIKKERERKLKGNLHLTLHLLRNSARNIKSKIPACRPQSKMTISEKPKNRGPGSIFLPKGRGGGGPRDNCTKRLSD